MEGRHTVLRPRLLAFLSLAAAAGLIAGCGGASSKSKASTEPKVASSGGGETAVVTLHNIRFHPATVYIKAGGSVTWKWEDADIETQHNVTSVGSTRFKSSATKLSGTYTVRFNTVGTYRFECTIHALSMQGKVIVR
jgi:plastocyanin